MEKLIAESLISLQKKFDVARIRTDFPCLQQKVHDKPLVYLDNAATTQKPIQVIEALKNFYCVDNSNVHRGVHTLSQRATEAFEAARTKSADFINAKHTQEIIFTRGATEAINLVAQSYGRQFLKAGDEIIISEMEHHSNIVPWQLLCQQIGAVLKIIPINDAGELRFDQYEKLLNEKTKLVAVGHISNALGTINPIKNIIDLAHQFNAKVIIDGAQAAPHTKIDVQALDCDFYTFSGHKVFGPTGIGILYGKLALLDAMPPYQGGGEMIKMVSFEKTIYNDLPHKFEAGTPNIAGAIGLGVALDYVSAIGLENIAMHEHELLNYATNAVLDFPGLRLIGTAKNKASILSFTLQHAHAHDVGTILDYEGIAIRTGHHCAMPVMEHFKVPATVRASFAFYNTYEEVDRLIAALSKVQEIFG
jgi:cysteine desulfurase/selenocysteine lyase